MLNVSRFAAVMVVGLGLLALTAVTAEAGKKRYRGNGGNFAVGLATGLIVGGIIAGSQRRGYYCNGGYCNGGYYGQRGYYGPRYYKRGNPARYYGRPVRRYYRPVPRYRGVLTPAHYDYCFSRYRSYRASDNTFQPYHGPRKACISPYY